MKLNAYIDHTLLKQDATQKQIETLCKQAMEYEFASVCINPWYVPYCKQLLKNSAVKVCTVIGFPLGSNTTETKAFETENAILNGADEIDMVINVSALKNGQDDYVLKDIQAVVLAAKGRLVKVILETCLLTDEEIVKACHLAMQAKAQYVKTSTGFSTKGATVEHVKLMANTVCPTLKVKASGGVRSYEEAVLMVKAGASRIGTSNGVAIVTHQLAKEDY